MVRCVRGAGCKVNKEWFVRRHCLLKLNPANGFVGHICCEVIVFLGFFWHTSDAIEDHRFPLIGLATDKTIEFVKA